MTFPHPKAGDEYDGEEHKPEIIAVLQNFLRRAIDVPDHHHAEDNVNPAKNCALSGGFHSRDRKLNMRISPPEETRVD